MHEEYFCVTAQPWGDSVISGFHACIVCAPNASTPSTTIETIEIVQRESSSTNACHQTHTLNNVPQQLFGWSDQNFVTNFVKVGGQVETTHPSLATSRAGFLGDMLCEHRGAPLGFLLLLLLLVLLLIVLVLVLG